MARKPRDYKTEAKYEDSPQQVKNRMARNRARYGLEKAGKLHKGDGMDAAHILALDKSPNNTRGVKVESASGNRSFRRDSKGNLVSEVSTRERKKK